PLRLWRVHGLPAPRARGDRRLRCAPRPPRRRLPAAQTPLARPVAPPPAPLPHDYQLGNRLSNAGWRLLLLPYVVETVLDARTLGDVWRHQLRWARTYRVCQPFNWFATIVIHTLLWGVLAVLATGGAMVGWLALALALGARLRALRAILGVLGDADTPRRLWLVPLKDLAYSAVFVASWLGRDVEWSGRHLRILPDGPMVALDGDAVAPGAGLEPAIEPPIAASARGGGRKG